MKYNKLFRFLLGMVSALFFISLIVNKSGSVELKIALSKIEVQWIAPALMALLVGYAIRIERWRLMLSVDNNNITWRNCAGPLLGSFAMNNILPFRAGDFMRAFAFNKQLGVTPSGVLATLLVERLFDLLMVLLFLIAGLHYFVIEIGMLFDIGEFALILFAIAIITLLAIPRLLFQPSLFICMFISKIAPRIAVRLRAILEHIFSVLNHLAGSKMILTLLGWSSLAWLAEGCVFWFVAISFPDLQNAAAAWLALPVGTLSTLIPSTPGYIGTFDFFTSETMQVLHNSAAGSIAFALLVHLTIWAPITIIGGFYLLLNSLAVKTISPKVANE